MILLIKMLIILYSVSYLSISYWIKNGGNRIKSVNYNSLPYVSVIVCARNEEKDLPYCLESLCNLDYPREKLEMIIVDDESDDRTWEIMKHFENRDPSFKMISTKNVPKYLPAKQSPMSHGIDISKGEIIIMTDADCVVKPGWINSHVNAYHDDIGIAGGVTRIRKKDGFFAILQDSDLATKHAVAMGCAGNNIPLTVMGNNISFRKEAYDKCGGLKNIRPSIVEDMAVMNAIVRSGYKLGWASDKESIVITKPEKSFGAFIEQRKRWTRELKSLSGIGKLMIILELFMLLTTVLSFGLLILCGETMPLIFNLGFWFLSYLIILKNIPDIVLTDILIIPVMIVFQMVYSVFLFESNISGRKNVVWKGRVYSAKLS